MTRDPEIVIQTQRVTKIYPLYDRPSDRLKEAFHFFQKKYHRDFYALRDISFEVRKGECLGIIGKNGAGKSTLLKIISRVVTPTSGTVEVRGRISSLLELGLGFNPEMTGIENIYLGGAILGFSRKEMENKLEDILSFAEIGDFAYQPVKTYSSGMYVRLAFALQTAVDPDILVVDEALSVGDMFFQAKCMLRLRQMLKKGLTLLFVSHGMDVVTSFCDRAMLLDQGKLLSFGNTDAVVATYYSMNQEQRGNAQPRPPDPIAAFSGTKPASQDLWTHFMNDTEFFRRKCDFQRIQNGKVSFCKVALLDDENREIDEILFGSSATLRMALEAHEDIACLGLGYLIRDMNFNDLFYSDSYLEDKFITGIRRGQKFIVDWKFKMMLRAGTYNITCAASIPVELERGEVVFCDYIPVAVQFSVKRGKAAPVYGAVKSDNLVTIIFT